MLNHSSFGHGVAQQLEPTWIKICVCYNRMTFSLLVWLAIVSLQNLLELNDYKTHQKQGLCAEILATNPEKFDIWLHGYTLLTSIVSPLGMSSLSTSRKSMAGFKSAISRMGFFFRFFDSERWRKLSSFLASEWERPEETIHNSLTWNMYIT